MTDNNTLLRTTTIGLDEYNRLLSRADDKDQTIGALNANIRSLENELEKKAEGEPLVKVTHFNQRYDEYSDDSWREQAGTEFMNLTDVKNMMKDSLKKEVEKEAEEFKIEIGNQKHTIKGLRDNEDTLQEKVSSVQRQLIKAKLRHTEEINDLQDSQSKREKDLNKDYTKDVVAYKETIKELKEEIQKVKDSKTDVEIEAKRNKEITDLKSRILDLEELINNLKDASFLTRTFRLKSLLQERDEARFEAARLERRADEVGTTWVKEGGKTRKYDSFKDRLHNFTNVIYSNVNGWITTSW